MLGGGGAVEIEASGNCAIQDAVHEYWDGIDYGLLLPSADPRNGMADDGEWCARVYEANGLNSGRRNDQRGERTHGEQALARSYFVFVRTKMQWEGRHVGSHKEHFGSANRNGCQLIRCNAKYICRQATGVGWIVARCDDPAIKSNDPFPAVEFHYLGIELRPVWVD